MLSTKTEFHYFRRRSGEHEEAINGHAPGNDSASYEDGQVPILEPAEERSLCDRGFINGETVLSPDNDGGLGNGETGLSLDNGEKDLLLLRVGAEGQLFSQLQLFAQLSSLSSRNGELYVIFTRLGGSQMARTDFGFNCLLSRQFLTCVTVGEVLVLV